MKLLHQGSVKDIYQLVPENELLFRFSNRYSIFDWGEMPDAIPGKGAALAIMGSKLLQHLETKNFKTHFLRAGSEPEDMIVQSVEVPRENLSAYAKRPVNTLVPLEVIYRFGVPKGSSLLRKYKTEADWKNAGFDRAYSEGEEFSEIAVDVTTKLEKLDRALSATEAQELAYLTPSEWTHLLTRTREIAREIQTVFAAQDMKLWDGKFEFAFCEGTEPGTRDFMLVDTIGLDEIRLTYHQQPLSKELLRQQYVNTSWYTALEQAKKKDSVNFRSLCIQELHEEPSHLGEKLINATSTLYLAVADLILNSDASQTAELHEKLQHSLALLIEPSFSPGGRS